MKKFLPFHRSLIGKDEEREIVNTLRSGWITRGPRTEKFEEMFKKYVNAKYAIGLNSCTSALHLALVAAGIKQGDEVITTPITFAPTANVIVHQKAKPVFVDVEPDTLNIDAQKIEERITSKTKAIIPVHFAGHPCEMDKILNIAKKYNLVVIEDAAHAVESKYKGRKVGIIGDLTCFSFDPVKNITTGEGGMLTTNKKELAKKIRILSLHGISKDAWKRYSTGAYEHWDIIYPGYKYHMFDIQAALGIHQLKRIENFLKIRKRYVEMYNEAFKDIAEIITLRQRKNIRHAHHLYVIMFKTENLTENRDVIINALQAEGIGIGIHYRALHLHPYYRKSFGFKRGDFPKAEYASDRITSLPLYPKMTEKNVKEVIAAVKKIIKRYSVAK